MRGIYTSVTDIRRKVFTEVARMAYEGGNYAEKIAKLPYKILPGEVATLREASSWSGPSSSERLRLAIGLPLRPIDEDTPIATASMPAPSPKNTTIRRW